MRWIAALILIGLIIGAGAYFIGRHEVNVSSFIGPLNPQSSGASHTSLCMSPPSALAAKVFANESGIFAEIPICFQGPENSPLDEAYVRYIVFMYDKYYPIGYLDESKYRDKMDIDYAVRYGHKLEVGRMMRAGVYVFNVTGVVPAYEDVVTVWNGYVIRGEKMVPLESIGTLVFVNRSICRVEEMLFLLRVYGRNQKNIDPPFNMPEVKQMVCDIYLNRGGDALRTYLGELMNRTVEALKTGAIPAPFADVNIAEMFDKGLASLLVYARLGIKEVFAELIPRNEGVKYIAYNYRLVSATPVDISDRIVINGTDEKGGISMRSEIMLPSPSTEGKVIVVYSVNPYTAHYRALSIRFAPQGLILP